MYFCLHTLETALKKGEPKIFNTDQGSQFTSKMFAVYVPGNNMQFRMDSKGRALDNIFIIWFWRSPQYENIHLNNYRNGKELQKVRGNYLVYYDFNHGYQQFEY